MKTKLLFLLLITFSYAITLAQENNQMKNPLKQKSISEAVQLEVGNDFVFQSFMLIGFQSEEQRMELRNELNQNPNFKKVKITSENEFRAFVQKDFVGQLTSFFQNRNIQIQKYSPRSVSEDGKPRYIDTGNPVEDKKNYDKAKREWIEQNAQEYKDLNNNKPVSPQPQPLTK